MVGFGEKIATQHYPPWADSYLDYNALKARIDDILAVHDAPDSKDVAAARKHIFQGAFDSEIVKVLRFYAQQRDATLEQVHSLNEEVDAVPQDVMENDELAPRERLDGVDDLRKRLQTAARGVQHLLEYVGLNMQGMRKILKKFAKNVDPTPPTPGYLALEIQHPHDPGWKLLQGTYLSPTLQDDLDAMIEHKRVAQAAGTIRQLNSQLATYRKTAATASSPNLEEEEATATLICMDTLLRDLGQAEQDADRNARLVSGSQWEARAGIFEPAPSQERAVATTAGLVLNCANSALYMANYNLLVPSVRTFLHHIGASASMAGIVIGCCDLASMPSTVGYSFWTNSNFRNPLIFSGLSCLIGNIVLCASYDSKLLWLLFLARLVTGVGAARSVSRRYIADFVSKASRTKASAAFVGSSALGMAMGPLLARAFQSFPTYQWHGVTFDPITMGAWSMTACWLVFLVATFMLFEDPLKKLPERTLPENQQPLLNSARPSLQLINDTSAMMLISGLLTSDRTRRADPGLHAQAENGEAAGGSSSGGAGGTREAAVEGAAEAPQAKPHKPALKRSESFNAAFGPTMVCVYALLVLKTAQQAFLDSLPLFTQTLYDWTDGTNGLYVGVLCLAMLPVTWGMGAVSARVPDRVLTAFSLVLTALGCAQLFFGGFPRWNFFLGGIWVLIGTIIMEGAAMSLESKVIHPSFAEGTWNAGLLSTEAGTLGRFTGNLLLSVSGKITGLNDAEQVRNFAHVLWSMVALVVASNLAWFGALYRKIQVLE